MLKKKAGPTILISSAFYRLSGLVQHNVTQA
jgi:hypothetical protein